MTIDKEEIENKTCYLLTLVLESSWSRTRRGKPLFQNYHTYMYYISLEASFQALFRTVFRLKIFPLEVFFFRSRNVHVWGTCLPKIVDSTYFQKNWRQQPLKTTTIVSYINLTVISSSIQNFFQIENIPTRSVFFDLEMCMYEVPVCRILLTQLIFRKIDLNSH